MTRKLSEIALDIEADLPNTRNKQALNMALTGEGSLYGTSPNTPLRYFLDLMKDFCYSDLDVEISRGSDFPITGEMIIKRFKMESSNCWRTDKSNMLRAELNALLKENVKRGQ